jgi:hypothetical protein
MGWTAQDRDTAPPGRHVQPAGTLAPAADGADRQVHTVWLAVDNGFSFDASEASKRNRITEGPGRNVAATSSAPVKCASVPPPIFVPFWVMV